jgi:hypothetical protein
MEVTDGIPANFVLNMDEIGHQDWADRTEKTSLVPADHPSKQINVPVSRTGKRIMLMAAIASSPPVAVSRDFRYLG